MHVLSFSEDPDHSLQKENQKNRLSFYSSFIYNRTVMLLLRTESNTITERSRLKRGIGREEIERRKKSHIKDKWGWDSSPLKTLINHHHFPPAQPVGATPSDHPSITSLEHQQHTPTQPPDQGQHNECKLRRTQPSRKTIKCTHHRKNRSSTTTSIGQISSQTLVSTPAQPNTSQTRSNWWPSLHLSSTNQSLLQPGGRPCHHLYQPATTQNHRPYLSQPKPQGIIHSTSRTTPLT